MLKVFLGSVLALRTANVQVVFALFGIQVGYIGILTAVCHAFQRQLAIRVLRAVVLAVRFRRQRFTLQQDRIVQTAVTVVPRKQVRDTSP